MTNNQSILTEIKGSTATLWLNRPEKHNAMDFKMIEEFLHAIRYLNQAAGIRIIVIRGKGSSFCAGADLNWMKRSALLSDEDNYNECEALANCFYEVYNSSRITISFVHGSSMGGANGFIAASDISISDRSAGYAFSEVRIGIVPAIIAPYVIHKMGRAKTMELMLTGRKFDAAEAHAMGLISILGHPDETEKILGDLVQDLLQGSPSAQKMIKTHLNATEADVSSQSLVHYTAGILAHARVAADAQEGIGAFLEKREPMWTSEIY